MLVIVLISLSQSQEIYACRLRIPIFTYLLSWAHFRFLFNFIVANEFVPRICTMLMAMVMQMKRLCVRVNCWFWCKKKNKFRSCAIYTNFPINRHKYHSSEIRKKNWHLCSKRPQLNNDHKCLLWQSTQSEIWWARGL